MMIKNRNISLVEFSKLYAGQSYDDVVITEQDILELKEAIESRQDTNGLSESNYYEFMKPIRNGIQFNNYVGVIQTNSGLTIEILPKIFGKTEEAKNIDIIRNLFIKMLKSVVRIDGKNFKMTDLNMRHSNIFEVFISMFLEQTNSLFKKGLKSNYVQVEGNEHFLKGKMLIAQQIRKNNINTSYFYNQFDEFIIDIPENQLLKTTLHFLLKRSRDTDNLKLIRKQLILLDQVSDIHDFKETYHKIQLNRSHIYYKQAIEWARIFLENKSFTSFRGNTLAFSILFPMERVFEAYIAQLTIQAIPEFEVGTQETSYWLFDKTEETQRAYNLRPDIVLRTNSGTIIADTKWKMLNYSGPSQADLYQMYAYYTRYEHQKENVKEVVLIYPYTDEYSEREFRSMKAAEQQISSKIRVKFIDLLSDNVEHEIRNIFL